MTFKGWGTCFNELGWDALQVLPEEKREALRGVLANDPRPRYQDDPARVYGLSFAGLNVRFRVEGELLTVVEVTGETGE